MPVSCFHVLVSLSQQSCYGLGRRVGRNCWGEWSEWHEWVQQLRMWW